jgi:hypothetical protein
MANDSIRVYSCIRRAALTAGATRAMLLGPDGDVRFSGLGTASVTQNDDQVAPSAESWPYWESLLAERMEGRVKFVVDGAASDEEYLVSDIAITYVDGAITAVALTLDRDYAESTDGVAVYKVALIAPSVRFRIVNPSDSIVVAPVLPDGSVGQDQLIPSDLVEFLHPSVCQGIAFSAPAGSPTFTGELYGNQ